MSPIWQADGQNAAKMMPDGSYRSAREGAVSLAVPCRGEPGASQTELTGPQTLYAHPSSVMFTRQPGTGWVVFTDVLETSKSFMRDLTVVDEDWLVELA